MTHAFSGGGTGKIDVSLRAAGHGHIELLFADDGCGMAPDVDRRAFDPFFTTHRHDGASGLGLHIVHSIVVDRLGGQLRLESKPGEGSRFQLVLPKRRPIGDPGRADRAPRSAASGLLCREQHCRDRDGKAHRRYGRNGR
ncbi:MULTISPECIES: sensor histidine kinase [Bradyrhizobium]|uniref:sensor histidine kinase n=1 Tax=Bradyrhizobium TaxID=374 RepID=UPI001EDC3E2A|nr:ATP-binding protein [Bradyrhizobium zhengyangense]MCG2638432.1 ATP-binding protein [Bradyrhizobium zhengyangense]